MKKIFLTLACVFMTLVSVAQMNVWHNGQIIYQRDHTQIDSITFSAVPTPPETNVPVMPTIANPWVGYTTIAIYAEVCPRGAYLFGTTNSWNIYDESYVFTPVPGASNWYAITVPYDANFAGKVVARPSDEYYPLSASYQWGKNYNPEDPGDVPVGTANTIILGGAGQFLYENQGQPNLINIANNGVIYIWIKNWATNPVIEFLPPLETCWAKSNWEGGDNWYWKQMTAKGNGVFELYTRWNGSGVNIAETEDGADVVWYGNPTLIDNPQAGDSVLVTYVAIRGIIVGTLSIQPVH